MATVKLFDAGGWFPIHNAVFDVIMPGLSPDAWKALCVAIRQTWGQKWELTDTNGDPKERHGWGRISYLQFQEKMGCENQATVSRALWECLEAGYLVRYEIGEEQGEPLYVYALNWDFEVVDGSEAIGTETGLVKQGEVKGKYGGNGTGPGDRFLISAWRLATGDEIPSDELDTLTGLLEPGMTFGSLANVILELGRRVDNLTAELVEAVVTGKMSIPPLEELEEPPPPPKPPRGPVMATTSTTETDPVLAEVVRMYENEIGLVTELTAQKLIELTEKHRDIDKWREAFEGVVRSNVRRLYYLEACLENVGKPKTKKPGRYGTRQRQKRAIREKPPAEDIDAETRARQRAALIELKRRQRERERK